MVTSGKKSNGAINHLPSPTCIVFSSILLIIIGAAGCQNLERETAPRNSGELKSASDDTSCGTRHLARTPGRILSPSHFMDSHVQHVYSMASKLEPLIKRLPCVCGCEESLGHKSLCACFTSFHGAECKVCQLEVIFANKESARGKDTATIRREIASGQWRYIRFDK